MPLPRDLIAQPGQFLYTIIPDPMINIKVLFFVIFAFAFYIILMMLSFLVTSLMMGSPEKNDPYYVPPVRRQPRRQR